jgi:hypothetical protein
MSDDLAVLMASMRQATCPACGYHVAVPFYDGGRAPLATLAWPSSADEARGMARLASDFVSCVDCSHVWNASFSYDAVPYTDKPNLMFNRGALWSEHIEAIRRETLRRVPDRPTVVEIGHGDGCFLAALAQARPAGRYIGFDPHGAAHSDVRALAFRPALFEPARHLAELRPDLIVSRHILEHLTDPLGFVQQISFAAACAGVTPSLYIEVPCIDRAIETGRTVDFYYEHNSHFTTKSFMRMLDRCAVAFDTVGHGYDGEVIYGFVRLGIRPEQVMHANTAWDFQTAAGRSRETIQRQLDVLAASGQSVAVWGGTGKAAAFIFRYGVDARRFPTVVDSDPDKAGTYVPGTGQEIRVREWLLDHPASVIIIPPQWRARDIVAEMLRVGIRYETILIEHQGRLINYFSEPHPYPVDFALQAAA